MHGYLTFKLQVGPCCPGRLLMAVCNPVVCRYHTDKLLAGRVVRAGNAGKARYEAGCAEAEKGVTDALQQLERGEGGQGSSNGN
jgi:hypothetical protein